MAVRVCALRVPALIFAFHCGFSNVDAGLLPVSFFVAEVRSLEVRTKSFDEPTFLAAGPNELALENIAVGHSIITALMDCYS